MGMLRDLDGLLRGRFTGSEQLREGHVRMPMRKLAVAALLCGAVYGAFMGVYAAMYGDPGSWRAMLSAAIKVPLLFLLTLLVTFPSLYVFSALADSRLGIMDTLRLLVGAVAVNLAVLASFGPITVFFTVFENSYVFIVLLNVFFFLLGGMVGLGFLSRAIGHVFASSDPDDEAVEDAAGDAPERAREQPTRQPKVHGRARSIFRVWLVIYGIVGAQMGWVLRPFVGNPDLPFAWYRGFGDRESNVFSFLADLFRYS